jgi:hypothetical protein
MHAIFAFTGSHLAHINQASQGQYLNLAYHHHGFAISQFRNSTTSTTSKVPATNPSATFVFCVLAALTSLYLIPHTDDKEVDLENFIHWVLFLRHSCRFAKSIHSFVEGENEVLALMPHQEQAQDVFSVDEGVSTSLNMLKSIILSPSQSFSETQTFVKAVSQTEFWFRLVPLHPKTLMYMVIWTMLLSDEYFEHLRAKSPISLAILAHWVVPLHHAPKRWFIGDWPSRVVSSIESHLGPTWSEPMSWVSHEVQI